jgi:hypothetical protein
MPPNARPRTGARSRAVAIGVAVLLFATALAVAAPTAGAAPQPVTTGGLDWGVKTSFRTYLSTVAAGTVTFADGATDNGNGTYHFPADSTSTFDPDAATTTASFRGSVHFVGHEGLLDITISNIRVRNAGAGGVLLADVVSVPFQGVNPPIPPSVTYDDVELLSLTGGTYADSGTAASWSAAASTLTSAGVPAFGNFYTAGTAFDAVTYSINLGSDPEEPEEPTAVGDLVWNISEYVRTSGSLWPIHEAGAPATVVAPTQVPPASPPTPALSEAGANVFTFPATSADYDPATGATAVQFAGSATVGNVLQGGYRIRFANPSIAVDAVGAGSLSAAVSYCTGAAGTQPCASGFSTPTTVVVVNFTLPDASVTDTGSNASWTVTPDYVLQNDPSNPTRRQFPQSLLDALAPATPSLLAHFRDSGSASDGLKPPSPLTVDFDYEAPEEPEEPTGPTTATQQITTEVLVNGGLTISVAGTTVTLPASTLSPDGTTLLTTGPINNVTVTDLRLGNIGWNARGQVGDFTGPAGATIAGSALGWTPSLVSASSGQTATAGGTVAPNIGQGLKATSTLGSSPSGASRGTAVFGAGLELRAPTTTPAGTYTATLTLTVI